MLRIGLTGGIGSGKSTVAAALAGHGAVIVDADRIAREVVEPGTPGLAAVVEAFGPEILTEDGALDRPALAAVIFADRQARATLDGIIHPLVRLRAAELEHAASEDAVVVHDVPLMAETGQGASYDLVLVVEADEEARVSRLVGRGLSESDARARIAAQATDEQRRAIADVVLDNRGTPEQLTAQVDRFWDERVGADALGAVELRSVDEDLLERMVHAAVAGASANEVTPALTAGDAWTPERLEWMRALHRASRAGLEGPAGQVTWAVVADGAVVGAVRLARSAEPGVLETGIWLTRGVRGRDVGRRAVAAVLERAATAGAAAVSADTAAVNLAALGLLRRLGFRLGTPGPDGRVPALLRLPAGPLPQTSDGSDPTTA